MQNGARTPCGTSACFSPDPPGDGGREGVDPVLGGRSGLGRRDDDLASKMPYPSLFLVMAVSAFCKKWKDAKGS